MSTAAIRLTVVLPFAPDERQAQDSLIAAAGALLAGGPFSSLDIVQLSPAAGAVQPRATAGAVTWWECICACATEQAPAETLAALVRAALAADGLRDMRQRLVLLPAGPGAEELAALLAADFKGCSLGRCAHLQADGSTVTGRRPAFGARVWIELRTAAQFCCATWRPETPGLASVQPLPNSAIRSLALSCDAPRREVELVQPADAQPRLEGAAAVVSGGRGMDGPEGFALLARIASSLGAAVGGSLPAVDAGWVPVARQIGQSGKFVAPRLYFAVGISGTPQHLAGVSHETRIVALNKDPDAAIFSSAEVGAVGDWRDILPLLAQQLEARQPAG
ncbi:MAG TPA: electron transfer flavoprotein subunit alpha/FixB family protein [Novosphingobium sp.]|nr:electron transfer flavoprotein subunit alpha/FixB family protein [Novosphingobium sp.]